MLVSSTPANVVLAFIVQSFWAKVGIDLKINVREPAIWTAMSQRQQYTMLMGPMTTAPYQRFILGKRGFQNYSREDAPVIEEAYTQMDAAWPDQARQRAILKTITPYALEQSYWVALPAPTNFVLFWPCLAMSQKVIIECLQIVGLGHRSAESPLAARAMSIVGQQIIEGGTQIHKLKILKEIAP